jgi:hypothetical protein
VTNSSNGGQTDRLTHIQKKQILLELSQAVPLKEIAVQYRTDVRTIQRVRRSALKKPGFISSLDQKVQDYLTGWEQARPNKPVTTPNVVPENVTNQVTLTDKNHIDDKSSKAKIYAQRLEDHYNVLSTTALNIADLIYYIGPDPGENTINQIVGNMGTWRGDNAPPAEQMEQYEELSKLLASTEAQWLFSHIKSEVPELFVHLMYARPEFLESVSYKKPELEQIYGWEDITEDDAYAYGEQLIHLLKLRAAQKEFPGTCEVCKGWK